MWGMNFQGTIFFLPTHDYTYPCDGQTLSGYDFSGVGYDFFLPTHTALGGLFIPGPVFYAYAAQHNFEMKKKAYKSNRIGPIHG